jgi:hypothetical protein
MVGAGTVRSSDIELIFAQLLGAASVAGSVSLGVLLLPDSAELEGAEYLLAALISLIGFAVARGAGAPLLRAVIYALFVLAAAVTIAVLKICWPGTDEIPKRAARRGGRHLSVAPVDPPESRFRWIRSSLEVISESWADSCSASTASAVPMSGIRSWRARSTKLEVITAVTIVTNEMASSRNSPATNRPAVFSGVTSP